MLSCQTSLALHSRAHCIFNPHFRDLGHYVDFTSRAVHQPKGRLRTNLQGILHQGICTAEAWHNMLPASLRYTPQNLEKTVVEGFVGTFISLHARYNTNLNRLNRHVRVRALSLDQLAHNIHQSFRSASYFITMMHSPSLLTVKGVCLQMPPPSFCIPRHFQRTH